MLRSSSRSTPTCSQPDQRPLLVVSSVRAKAVPGASGQAQYTAVLRNLGESAAGPFQVTLTVNQTSVTPTTVATLPASGQTVLQFVAPRCSAGSVVAVTPDPQQTISEASGGGLAKDLRCPLPGKSGGGGSGSPGSGSGTPSTGTSGPPGQSGARSGSGSGSGSSRSG